MKVATISNDGIIFFSFADINKVLKEPSNVLLPEQTIHGSNLTEGYHYIRKDGNPNYYFTAKIMDQILKRFKKTLNGKLAIRLFKEAREALTPIPSQDGELPQEAPETAPAATEAPKTKPKLKKEEDFIVNNVKDDNSPRHLTNPERFGITHHAALRIKERFGKNRDSEQRAWWLQVAPKLRFIGTQAAHNYEVWGSDEAKVIVSQPDTAIITVLEPNMRTVVTNNPSYDDLKVSLNEAIASLQLKESRSFWEDLAIQFTVVAEFAQEAAASLERTRNGKSSASISIMHDTEEAVIEKYNEVTYQLDQLIDTHKGRVSYLEKKKVNIDAK